MMVNLDFVENANKTQLIALCKEFGIKATTKEKKYKIRNKLLDRIAELEEEGKFVPEVEVEEGEFEVIVDGPGPVPPSDPSRIPWDRKSGREHYDDAVLDLYKQRLGEAKTEVDKDRIKGQIKWLEDNGKFAPPKNPEDYGIKFITSANDRKEFLEENGLTEFVIPMACCNKQYKYDINDIPLEDKLCCKDGWYIVKWEEPHEEEVN